MKICITSASGVEAVTKRELQKLGYPEVPFVNGRGTLEGEFIDVAILNLKLETAGRGEIELSKF